MTQRKPLPLSDEWTDPDSYVDSLLSFVTSSVLFRNLCGGVHILDFLTREPPLYTSLLPEDWRDFFEQHDVQDTLHLFLREDIEPLLCRDDVQTDREPSTDNVGQHKGNESQWKGGPLPPQSLIEYIHDIRKLSLRREFSPETQGKKEAAIPGRIAVGMNPKKRHEVGNFSRYVDSLSTGVAEKRGEDVSHIVDFGSGQNYLGRTLASAPYNKHIIAIERKHQFISGGRRMDVLAKVAKKKVILQNKKEYLQRTREAIESTDSSQVDQSVPEEDSSEGAAGASKKPVNGDEAEDEDATVINVFGNIDLGPDDMIFPAKRGKKETTQEEEKPKGAIEYIEHEIKDGYLEPIIKHAVEPETLGFEPGSQRSSAVSATSANEKSIDARVMVVSLHSCGNLLHHGVRSLVLNPSVVAVAMIGCCYNLVTERLGPATYKLPVLRSHHPRLTETSQAYDPHGFPMSKRLETYSHGSGTGVKLNITARMMAVQAPFNWGRKDSEDFFTRHFYRALLQRILLDKDIVPKPVIPSSPYEANSDSSGGTALIVGSLRKSAFASFPSYVRAAVVKLCRLPHYGEKVREKMADISDEELYRYEAEYWPSRRHLSVVWSLMAFSAAVVEALIVVDRWQFLREHDSVKECWVEPVFEYKESPRNLAVVGIKK